MNSRMITWPVPDPVLPETVDPVLAEAARAATTDPVDGTANATAGVPLSAFAAAVCRDGVLTESLTCWLDTGRR